MSDRLGIKFKRQLIVGLLSWGVCLANFGVSADQDARIYVSNVDESRLKAATIIGILRYTEWDPPLGNTIKICVASESNVVKRLRDIVSKPIVHGKSIEIESIEKLNMFPNDCNVILSTSSKDGERQFIESAQNCLVICDDCGVVGKFTSILIEKRNNKIIFEVNLDQAKKHQLKFRSALLELAIKVRGKP